MKLPPKQHPFLLLHVSLFIYLIGMNSKGFSVPIKTLLFDVFGTCVELTSSLESQVLDWGQKHSVQIDEVAFVSDWIEDHQIAVEEVRQGKIPWMTIDEIHGRGVKRLLPQYLPPKIQVTSSMISEFNRFWHRLKPWSDVPEGLNRMHQRFELGTLSNANETLLKDLAAFGFLPWDLFFAGDQTKHYKPDPEVYEAALKKLGLQPQEILLVASHEYDLREAKKHGWRTALVRRQVELKRDKPPFSSNLGEFDYVAESFVELAQELGS